jgi:hypothetical protein
VQRLINLISARTEMGYCATVNTKAAVCSKEQVIAKSWVMLESVS